ncbi:MAG TPA: cardiolipin synthase [Thermoanaerobaculia bacterium]
MLWKIEKRKGTDYVRTPLVFFVALIVMVAALTIMLWSATRGRDTHLHVRQPSDFTELLPSIVGITQGSLDPGNDVKLLQNGDQIFPPMLADIAAARQSVHVESYIWWKGPICDKLANALATKASQGVEVRLLVDASGGRRLERRLEKLMLNSGVQVRRFHPLRFSNLGRMNNRDHRKLAIIDGRIAYIGGFGFAKEWEGHAQDRDHWRDTGLRVSGPVVNRIQGAFCENWIEETGEVPAGEKYFPHLGAAGPTQAHVAYTSPNGSVSSVQVLYYLAITSARREIIIQNPYMLPDDEAIAALGDAVQRGVDVKIMVPATGSTDSPIVQHASHHQFGALLKNGVKIWEYRPTLLHQKIIVVDGIWSCVGSTNFDDRSFQLNDEISLGVFDRNIANGLRTAFANDLRGAKERHYDEWRHRSLWHKLIDQLAYLGSSQL